MSLRWYPYQVRQYKAKVTSKNQLTLPKGVSAFMHVQPGDEITFTVDEDQGQVRVEGPSFMERVKPWIGRWRGEGPGKTSEEIDAWIRELRGPRDE